MTIQETIGTAVAEFVADAEKMKVFVNGSDSADYTAPDGQKVPSIRHYLKAIHVGMGGNGSYLDAMNQKPIFIAGSGQSNLLGANAGGPNPANPKVKAFDGQTMAWGSSDYTKAPWTRASPDGSRGNNNVVLSLAHRLADETGRPVYVVIDGTGGTSIDAWVGAGVSSVRHLGIKNKIEAALATPELAAFGITEVDFFVWAQGEEDALTHTGLAYTGKFKTLVSQFRGESWISDITPILIMGMSNLHTRYHVSDAQIRFCDQFDRNCIYVNSMGLKTQYDIDGVGDNTHFLGASLWEAGYHRAWYALQNRAFTQRSAGATIAYGRASGRWDGETVAVLGFSGFSSYNSKTSEFPVNGVVGLDSISWGWLCGASGRYSLAGGYTCTVDAAGRYNHVWGRDIAATATANYSGGFGYQNQLTANYGFVTGRGHVLADDGCSAFGFFSKYVTAQTDPIVAQYGIGTTDANRKNALTIRKSGLLEFLVSSASDPAQNQEASMQLVNNTTLRFKVRGTDGIVRGVNLTLS